MPSAADSPLEVKTTTHGEQRLRYRIGLPDRAHKRAINNAFVRGKRKEAYKGQMRKYLEKLHRNSEFRQSADDVVVYAGNVWLYAQGVLITTWRLPDYLLEKDK